MIRLAAWCALIAAVATAGCGGGAPISPNITPCNMTAIPSVQILYPEPGATNIPDNAAALVYSSSEAFPIVIAATSTSRTVAKPTPVPSPLPSPAATPRPGVQQSLFAVAMPTLNPATTYSVVAIDTVTPSECVPSGQIDIPMGSFSTR